MIQISENLQLKKILSSDSNFLFKLLKEVYSSAYSHFWVDNGEWYVHSQYSKENILKELSEEKTEYYFVIYKDEIIGNFRIIWEEKLAGLTQEKHVKLHRLYLYQKTQGKGIGKELLSWLEKKAIKKGFQIIWLDAMNEQPQAFKFYKKLGYIYHSQISLPYDLLFDEVRKMSQVYKILKS